jgi:hypothetical protein
VIPAPDTEPGTEEKKKKDLRPKSFDLGEERKSVIDFDLQHRFLGLQVHTGSNPNIYVVKSKEYRESALVLDCKP